MIGEGVVLLRVKDLQKSRGRITFVVVAQLVQLIQHKNRIVGAGLFQALQNTTRQSADIGASMSANLCLIAHSAQ